MLFIVVIYLESRYLYRFYNGILPDQNERMFETEADAARQN
jgi:hypothetical protein